METIKLDETNMSEDRKEAIKEITPKIKKEKIIETNDKKLIADEILILLESKNLKPEAKRRIVSFVYTKITKDFNLRKQK